MEPWLTTLLSVAGAGAVALGARLIDKRRGVPTEVDAVIDQHVHAVIRTLETRVDQLETDKRECLTRLDEEQRRGDRLERQVNRLLAGASGS